MDEQADWVSLQTDLLANFPRARIGRRLTLIDVPTRNIPSVAVGLPDEQHARAVNEQRTGRDPRCCKVLNRAAHFPSLRRACAWPSGRAHGSACPAYSESR